MRQAYVPFLLAGITFVLALVAGTFTYQRLTRPSLTVTAAPDAAGAAPEPMTPVIDPLTLLEADERVVSIAVRPEAALDGALQPGDRVDVAAVWPGPEGKPGRVEVVAAGITLLDLRNGVGQSVAAYDLGDPLWALPTTALLRLSPQQATAVVAAVESRGAIYLWLVQRPVAGGPS